MSDSLTNLDRKQKAICALGAVLAAYFLILVVIDAMDGSLDAIYYVYYLIGFLVLPALWYLMRSRAESGLRRYEGIIWVLFMLWSVGVVLAYIGFNVDAVFARRPNMGTPVVALVLTFLLIAARPMGRPRS